MSATTAGVKRFRLSPHYCAGPVLRMNERKEIMSRSSLRHLFVLAAAAFIVAPAMALTVVTTSAPAVNYVFSPTGIIYPTDMSTPILNGGFIQSRVFQGQAGSPAAGKWVYEYRVDLRNAVGILSVPYVTDVAVPFGTVRSYDYNFDGNANDQVFVITSGGLGTIGLQSSTQWWGFAFFKFTSPVWAGGSPGTGQSSYFWGLVSDHPPAVKTGYVYTDGPTLSVNVFAPNL